LKILKETNIFKNYPAHKELMMSEAFYDIPPLDGLKPIPDAGA